MWTPVIPGSIGTIRGCPYFIFDRNACSVSQCCRLKIDFSKEDMELINTPEELRFVGGQNVSINLPNVVLKVGTNFDDVLKEIEHRIDLACRAHISRKEYLTKISNKENSPLSFYNNGMDKTPYIRPDRISWLIGIVGLNECVYNLMGEELHSSDQAFIKGLEIITFIYIICHLNLINLITPIIIKIIVNHTIKYLDFLFRLILRAMLWAVL